MAGTPGFETHQHGGMVHEHEHIHVTHHAKGGVGGSVEHLLAEHSHSHNHTSLAHEHAPHQNAQREHSHEGHIHDHAHPTES